MSGNANSGRRPNPSKLKLLTGKKGRGLNAREPQPAPLASGRADYLTGAARAKWDELAVMLGRLGLLTEADRDALATLCDLWARQRAMRDFVVAHGATYEAVTTQIDTQGMPVDRTRWMRRPEADLELKYLAAWERLARSFGLLPDSRGRLRVDLGTSAKRGSLDWSKASG